MFGFELYSSYQDAEEALRKACGISINDDTIRLVTNCIGKAVCEEDCRKADSIFKAYDSGEEHTAFILVKIRLT